MKKKLLTLLGGVLLGLFSLNVFGYTVITDANVNTSSANMLRNPSFLTLGDPWPGTKTKFIVGTPWSAEGGREGCRVAVDESATYLILDLIWTKTTQISQPLNQTLKPKTWYEVRINEFQGGNGQMYTVGVRSENGTEYYANVKLGSGSLHVVRFYTPATIDSGTYTFFLRTGSLAKNADGRNYIKWLSMVEYGDASDAIAHELQNGGSYYLKNVASGKWLGSGGSSGYEACLLDHANCFTFGKNGNGVFAIDSHIGVGNSHYFGYNDSGISVSEPYVCWYVDMNADNGNYTLTLNYDEFVGWDGESAQLKRDITSATNANAQWKIYSEADLITEMKKTAYGTAVDATFLIKGADFSYNDQRVAANWAVSSNCTNYNLCGGDDVNRCVESYHSPFTISQTILSVPNGKYQLTAQGFYSQDGTDNDHLPQFFMNGAKATVPVKTGTEDSMAAASESFSNGLYKIDPIEAIVTNGTLTIGIDNPLNGNLWVVFDNFELTYLGVNLALYQDILSTIRAEANALLTEDMNKTVKQALSSAYSTTASTSATLAAHEAAVDKLNEAISAAKASATVYAGIQKLFDDMQGYLDVTTYNNFLADASTIKSAYDNGTITDGVEETAALMDLSDDYEEYKKPHDGGEYYLYNVASGKWLGGGNWYGTCASLLDHANYFTFHKVSDGVFTIDSHISNGGDSHYFGDNGYVDAPAANWKVKKNGSNYVFTLDDVNYIGYDGSSSVLKTDITSATADAAQWKIYDEAEYIAEMKKTTYGTAVDVTFLIKGANFSRNDQRVSASWAVSSNCTNYNLSGGDDVNRCAESYHSPFTISQTIEGVPNGKYQLTAQGFYSQGGTDNDHLPQFFLNSEKATVPVKTGTEDSMTAASASFSNGLYKIDPIEAIVTNGMLTIGIENPENGNLWVIFDNFELTYLGINLDIAKDAYDDAYAEAEALLAEDMNDDVKQALQDAYEATANPSTTVDGYVAAVDELSEALSTAKASVAVYASIQKWFDDALECLTVAGYSKFLAEESAVAVKSAYDNGTITDGTEENAALMELYAEYEDYMKPRSGKAYYVYNVKTGLFLSRGMSWGTQAVGNDYGMPWQLSIDGDGHYTLRMLDFVKNNEMSGLGDNAYTDNGSPVALIAETNADGDYTLTFNGHKLSVNADNTVGFTDTDNCAWSFLTANLWKDVQTAKTEAQNEQIIAATMINATPSTLSATLSATGVTATDKSDKVPFPSNSSWTHTTDGSRTGDQNEGDYGVESFGTGEAKYTYTVTDLPKGLYKVGVKAMQRTTWNNACYAVGQAGFTASNAYLDANGYRVQIKDWYSGCSGNSYPNSTGDFVNAVGNGAYLSEVYAIVGDDGKLALTVAAPSFWGGCWFVFNGITLTYYEGYEVAVSEALANSLIATAPTGAMDANLKSALEDAISDLENNRSTSNYEALQAAIAAASASAALYAQVAPLNAAAALLDDAGKAAYASTLAAYNNGSLTTYADARAAYLVAVKSQTTEGSDMTGAVENPNFDGNIDGWTDTYTSGNHGYQGSSYTNGTSFVNKFMECWTSSSGALANGKLSQTITGLPEGEYTMSADIISCRQDQTLTLTGVYIFAQSDALFKSDACATANAAPETVSFDFKMKGETLELGLMTDNTNCNWVAFDNVRLTYNGPLQGNIYQDQLSEALATYTDRSEEYAAADLVAAYATAYAAAQTAAATTGESDEYYQSALSDLEAAAEALTASVTAYANTKASLDAYDVKAATLDDAGKAAYNNAVSAIKQAYSNKTLTADKAADVQKAFIAAVKAQTAIDSDWSALAENVAWTGATGTYQGCSEKYNDDIPFAVGDVLYQTIEGLDPYAKYEVAFTAVANVARNLDTETYAGDGIAKIFANGTEEGITVGTNDWCTPSDAAYQRTLTCNADKNGKIKYGIKNVKAGGQWYVAKFTSLTYKGCEANMTITAVKWGTFVAPFAVTIPDGVEAYTCDAVEDDVITTTEVEITIPANTPVLVYSETTVNETFSGKAVAIEGNLKAGIMVGTYEDVQPSVGCYLLQKNDDNTVTFNQIVSGGATPWVRANRCYLSVPSGTSSTMLRFGGATGIQSMEQQGESVIYDLTGRRVDAATKGIYIVNGKKMLVK